MGCEGIVRQREKEQHAAALAKCSTGASTDSSSQKMIHHDSTISNEVFRSHIYIHFKKLFTQHELESDKLGVLSFPVCSMPLENRC